MTPNTYGRSRSRLPSVFVLTDDTRLPDTQLLAETMPRNWGLLLRHYKALDRAQLATDVARICRTRGIFLMVAGDWRLAAKVRANGVHMPEGLLRNSACAALLNACRDRTLTTSAHGTAGLRLAKSVGADGVFLSPVNPTESHTNAKPLGPWPFAALTKNYGIPTYALGGVGLHDQAQLRAMGAAGIAGISLAKEKR